MKVRTGLILFLLNVFFIISIMPSVVLAALRASVFEQYCLSSTSPANRIFISDNSAESVATFVNAVKEPNTIVCLKDTDLDLTDAPSPINVAAGVKILGTRSSNNIGSMLFVTNNKERYLLTLIGDNIVINGIRIIGADFSSANKTPTKGIIINSNLKIDLGNLEVAGWGIAGIEVRDDKTRSDEKKLDMDNHSDVYIHDSYIHHNQHGSMGYGANVSGTAYAFIKQNVFDHNRHAIASDGKDDVGYFAYRNLVLKGGGEHELRWCDSWICELPNSHTHQFDVHGTEGGDYKGGHAGERVVLFENTIQYDTGNGYYLRGKPTYKTEARYNFFSQPRFAGGNILDGAFATYYSPYSDYIYSVDNRIEYDTYGKYKVCDMDGDSKDDLVQPAGATWWFSGQAKYPWTFLERSYTELSELIALADFDNDGTCDVAKFAASQSAEGATTSSSYTAIVHSPAKDSAIDVGTPQFDSKNVRLGDFDGDGHKDFFILSNGNWYSYSTFSKSLRHLTNSAYPINRLAFGDFNGDKKTDVLAVSDNQDGWVVSWSGIGAWEKINDKLSDDIEDFQIADVNGDGKDDVILIKTYPKYNTGFSSGLDGYNIITHVSLSGSEAWLEKNHYVSHKVGWEGSHSLRYFIGKFDDNAGADLLVIDTLRNGLISSGFSDSLKEHGLFHY